MQSTSVDILDFLRKNYKLEDVQVGMSIRDDLGMDSIDLVEIAFHLEEFLGRVITDEELASLIIVQDVIDLVEINKVGIINNE